MFICKGRASWDRPEYLTIEMFSSEAHIVERPKNRVTKLSYDTVLTVIYTVAYGITSKPPPPTQREEESFTEGLPGSRA